jgi:hypothetical protein
MPSRAAKRWKVRTDTRIRAAEAGLSAPREAAKSATSFSVTSLAEMIPRSVLQSRYRWRSRRYAATVLIDRPRSISTYARYPWTAWTSEVRPTPQ